MEARMLLRVNRTRRGSRGRRRPGATVVIGIPPTFPGLEGDTDEESYRYAADGILSEVRMFYRHRYCKTGAGSKRILTGIPQASQGDGG